jgi:hypothetical protein
MLKIIENFFQDEKIQLTELSQNIGDRFSVLVSFLDTAGIAPIKNELW